MCNYQVWIGTITQSSLSQLKQLNPQTEQMQVMAPKLVTVQTGQKLPTERKVPTVPTVHSGLTVLRVRLQLSRPSSQKPRSQLRRLSWPCLLN